MPETMMKLLMAIAVHMIRTEHDGQYTANWQEIADIAQNEVDNLSISIDHDDSLVHFKVEKYQRPTLFFDDKPYRMDDMFGLMPRKTYGTPMFPPIFPLGNFIPREMSGEMQREMSKHFAKKETKLPLNQEDVDVLRSMGIRHD